MIAVGNAVDRRWGAGGPTTGFSASVQGGISMFVVSMMSPPQGRTVTGSAEVDVFESVLAGNQEVNPSRHWHLFSVDDTLQTQHRYFPTDVEVAVLP